MTLRDESNTGTGHASGYSVIPTGVGGAAAWQWSAFGPGGGEVGFARCEDDARTMAKAGEWRLSHGPEARVMTQPEKSDTPWLVYLATDPPSFVELPFTDATQDVEAAIAELKGHHPAVSDVRIYGIYRPRTLFRPR
jgi:hypothetical protein